MRPSPSRFLRVVALGATCVLFVPAARSAGAEEPNAPAAAPTIYKWVDANGVAHYTTDLSRVPRSVRSSVRELGSSSGASAQEGYASRDAGQSAPAPEAQPAAPPPEWDVGEAPGAAPGAAPAAAPQAPPPAPAPRGQGTDRWAETDRPNFGPDEAPPSTPATQTASAEPAAASATEKASQKQDLDTRIAALQTDIASDEEVLKTFLAVPTPQEPGEVAADTSFREVAERLPKRLAELRSLESERAQLDAD